MLNHKYILILELLSIIFFIPFIIIIFSLQKYVILLIFFASLFAIFYLTKKKYKFNISITDKPSLLFLILFRFSLIFIMLFLISEKYMDTDFVKLTKNWDLILLVYIVFYILMSVIPQEIIFRSFFFHRYDTLFENKKNMIILNIFLFTLMHVIYLNVIVLILSFFGGMLFALTYYKNKSLGLVILEHSLLGSLIFFLGFGKHFHNSIVDYIYF